MSLSLLETFRVLLALLLFTAPGVLAVDPLFGARAPLGAARAAVGGAIGLGAAGLLFWIAARLGLSLEATIASWVGFVLLLAGWRLVAGRRRRKVIETAAGPQEEPRLFSGASGRLLFVTMLLAALLAPRFGAYMGASADSWDYLNRATSILRSGRFDAPNPYSPEFHNPYDPTFYGWIAAVAKVSGVSPALAWPAFPVVLTPLEIGVVAAATALITTSAAAGAAAGLLYTVFYGPFFLFRNSGHHQMLGDALFLVALSSLFLFWREGRRRNLLVGAAMSFAAVTFHHFLVVQTGFMIGMAGFVLLLASRNAPERGRRAILHVVVVAATLLPLFLFIHHAYLDRLDPKSMNRNFQEMVSPLLHFGPLHMPDPFPWYFTSFWRPLPALLLLAWFLPRLRRSPAAAALAILLAAPVLIVLNPLVFPLVAGVTGLQVATRLLNLTAYPSVMLLGWAAAEWWQGRYLGEGTPALPDASGGRFRRGLVFACVALSILAVLPQELIRYQGDYSAPRLRYERENSPAAWPGALSELSRRAKPGDVVLSDFVTGYSLPSFAPVSILATFREDFTFQTGDHPERLLAIDQVLGPLVPADSTLLALQTYDVDWIFLNRRVTNPLSVDKLDALAGAGVDREFEMEGIVAWSVNPAAFRNAAQVASDLRDRLLIPPEIFSTLREPGTGLHFDAASGIGAVMGPDSAAAGDTLYVTLYYEWRPGARGHLYPKLVREDAYGSRRRWFVRQFRGSILGRPDALLFPRATDYLAVRSRALPPGSVFADMFEVPVIPGTTPGRYGLYVREGGFPTEGDLGLQLGRVLITRKP